LVALVALVLVTKFVVGPAVMVLEMVLGAVLAVMALAVELAVVTSAVVELLGVSLVNERRVATKLSKGFGHLSGTTNSVSVSPSLQNAKIVRRTIKLMFVDEPIWLTDKASARTCRARFGYYVARRRDLFEPSRRVSPIS